MKLTFTAKQTNAPITDWGRARRQIPKLLNTLRADKHQDRRRCP
jgi:hypothetical protein